MEHQHPYNTQYYLFRAIQSVPYLLHLLKTQSFAWVECYQTSSTTNQASCFHYQPRTTQDNQQVYVATSAIQFQQLEVETLTLPWHLTLKRQLCRRRANYSCS